MPLRSDSTALGRRCARAFTFIYRYVTIPLLLAMLCYGHHRSVSRALTMTRTRVVGSKQEASRWQVRNELHAALRWSYVLAIAALLLFVVERAGRRKLRKVGDEIEGLVENVLHDLYHGLVDIHERTRQISRRECDPEVAAREIGETCKRYSADISEYMQLVVGFKSYIPESAKRVNLTSAAWGVVKKWREDAHGLDVKCTTPPADVVINAHLELVGTVLDELVGNAVKYTDSGSVSVTLEELWRKVRITVADTGRGMSRCELRRAFDLFYRSPSAKDRPGNGLGLATVSAIVRDRYRGTIRVKSQPGHGTTITVTLPKSVA